MALESSSLLSNFTDPHKLYLYLWHTYSPVVYSLYEIDVPNPLPPPPTKDAQDYQIINPSHVAPILQLKTGEYPVNMCCVSLDSKLYFMGGENDIDHPCIDEDVKIKYKNVKRDIFPRDVYIFDPTTDRLPRRCTSMNSGKSWPWAFVADEKIYVLGSNFTTDIFDIFRKKDSKLKSLHWFEVYDPKDGSWTTLRNPPIGNVETRWVGHAVDRRKVFLKAWQRGKERLYCFDLGRGQWTKGIALPSHLRNVSGRIEFVEGTFYGCYHNTVAAIAPVAKEDEQDEDEDEDEEEEEEEEVEEEETEEEEGEEEEVEEEETEEEEGEEVEEEETEEEEGEELEEEEKEEREELGEGDELNIQQQQQQQQEDEMCTRFKNYRRHVVSREMGMNAIFNVPQQLQSSSTLLHLGSRCFCYVMTGMPLHPKYGSDHAIEDDKVRVISIVIFQALGETYKEGATRLFRAKFLHSAHYAVKTSFPNEGVIHGCFSLGWESQQPPIEAVAGLKGCHTQAMGKFQTQYQVERSPFDKQELGSNSLVAAGIDYLEGSAKSRRIGGEVRLQPINESDSSTGLRSQRQGRRRDDRQRQTMKVPLHQIANINILPDGDFSWRKYGQKHKFGSKYPRKDDRQRKTLKVRLPQIAILKGLEGPLDDGFSWREYTQEIPGSKYLRSNTNTDCFTLKEWLERNRDNWCPIYRKWNVDRPTEKAKKLIQCILHAVYDSHSNGIFHGFLHHPENFYIECNRKNIKVVHLLYKNMEPKTSTEKAVRQNDMLAMSHVIFDQILGGRIQKKYPEDLEDLCRLLSDDMSFRNWKIIVDHPSLWHWKIRFNYIERVWMQFLHADRNLKVKMKDCLRRIPGYDWKNKIPSNTPLERIFNNNFYRSTPDELFRYIRGVRCHYMDGRIDPQMEADYLEEQFIEHKTTEVCELLLVYLHRMVCQLGIKI